MGSKSSKSAPAKKKSSKKSLGKKYAKAHGVERSGSTRRDSFPDTSSRTTEPEIDPIYIEDEGLLLFVQATTCRRKIWATVFSNNLSQGTSQIVKSS